MLKKTRIILAAVFFVAITLIFADHSGWAAGIFGWMAKIQILPAVLALNVGVVVSLLVLTLVFGRIYCSVICPLGVWQDAFFALGKKGSRHRLGFSSEKKWLRYGVWVLFIAAMAAGLNSLAVIIAPYSAYGRFVSSVTGLASGREALTATAVIAFAVAAVTAVLAWLGGRTWCNTICPVGTTLGLFSRFSLLRPVIDKAKCRNCHLCEKGCKASCIDISSKSIDYSRCVDCFDCIGACKFDALKYRFAYGRADGVKSAGAPVQPSDGKPEDSGRRAFLGVAALLGASVAAEAQEKKRDGGLAPIIPKARPGRTVRLTPFGSKSVKHFYDRCTSCQLCISICPNDVLRPSADLEHLMQPEMNYDKGFCRPECVKCSEVCPAGAITAITPEQKTAIHIGIASVDRGLCVVERDGVSCGNCARHCPAGAITMVAGEDTGAMVPVVDKERCIGCGACEYVCPSRPISAITVTGRQVHVVD